MSQFRVAQGQMALTDVPFGARTVGVSKAEWIGLAVVIGAFLIAWALSAHCYGQCGSWLDYASADY